MTAHDNQDPGTTSPELKPSNRRRSNVMEPLIMLAFVVGWIVLQIWVLPKMGVRT